MLEDAPNIEENELVKSVINLKGLQRWRKTDNGLEIQLGPTKRMLIWEGSVFVEGVHVGIAG